MQGCDIKFVKYSKVLINVLTFYEYFQSTRVLVVLLSDSCACHSALSSGNVHNVLLRADVHSYVFGDQNK